MASLGTRVLSEILRAKTLPQAWSAGLSSDLFKDATERRVFAMVEKHFKSTKTPKQYPTIEGIKKRIPSFNIVELSRDHDQLETLIEELREACIETEVIKATNDLVSIVNNGDSQGALKYIKEIIPYIDYQYKRQEGFGINDVLDAYEKASKDIKTGANMGIPWRWEELTLDTQGKKPGDFIVMYGRMKDMKCVCEGEHVAMADRSWVPIEKVPKHCKVLSYDERSKESRKAKAMRVPSGVKNCVEVTTKLGASIKTSEDHPFLTPENQYKRIKDLKKNDRVVLMVERTSSGFQPYHDEIESIRPIGKVNCHDICIMDGGSKNFVAEGFVVHNTWIALAAAEYDYSILNKRVLIWSKEMSPGQLNVRLSSIVGGFDYQMLKKNHLPNPIHRKIKSSMDQVRESQDIAYAQNKEKEGKDLKILCGREAPTSLEGLEAVVEDWGPDILYLDTYRHLSSARSEKERQHHYRIAALSEDIKQMAIRYNIPIVAVHHANREGEKLGGKSLTEVSDTDVIGKEADLLLRVLRKLKSNIWDEAYEGFWNREFKELLKKKNQITARNGRVPKFINKKLAYYENQNIQRKGAEIVIRLSGNREGVLEGFKMDVVPGYKFNVTNSNMSGKEIDEWLKDSKKDNKQEETRNPVGKFKPNS